MTLITKPMLATPIKTIQDLTYPLMASPKIDGIRCLKIDGQILSRTFKPIPNDFIRETLEKLLPDGVDGELLVGDTFQDCTSGVMSKAGEPDFTYWIFDFVPTGTLLETSYKDRVELLQETLAGIQGNRVVLVPQVVVNTPEELEALEEKYLAEGYEGVMVRDPEGRYKCGRSTLKEGLLLKIKRFQDSEARILDFVEMMQNNNEPELDAFGNIKRSTSKENKVPKGTLGKFIVEEVGKAGWTETFEVGTGLGLTQSLRQEIWNDRDNYLGKIIKYKFQPHGGKDRPRIPIFLGFRSTEDM